MINGMKKLAAIAVFLIVFFFLPGVLARGLQSVGFESFIVSIIIILVILGIIKDD